MVLRSYNALIENETVPLGPRAKFRSSGELFNNSKSAVRALDIFELFAKFNTPLRAVEIARALNLSPSSTDQILKTMVDSAYVVFDPRSKRYWPSHRAARFANNIARSYFTSDQTDQLLDVLHRKTGERVGLFTAQVPYMQVIQTQNGAAWPIANDGIHNEDTALGLRIPLFGSSSGAAWLAAQSDETVEFAMRLGRRELGGLATSSLKIRRNLSRVRERGHALGGGLVEGTFSISMSLPPCPAGVVLVLSVMGLEAPIVTHRDQLAAEMSHAIKTILVEPVRR